MSLTSSEVIEGKVVEVLPTEEIKKKGSDEVIMTKRFMWVEIDGDTEYPQIIPIEFLNDKTSLIGKYNPGDTVTVDVNLRGRIADLGDNGKKCFFSFAGWRIKGAATGASEPAASTQESADTGSPEEQDDLPF